MSIQGSRLANACTGVGDAARKILDWIGDSGGLMAAERAALLHEVYRTETSASALARAMLEAPCVGFVGPSRSGKTQLISAIVEREGGAPAIRFDGIREQVSYLKHIAPDGGRFGSACVIRLTAKTGAGAQNFPVGVRLLTLADQVKILGGAFMAGAERGDLEPSMAMIDSLVAEARGKLMPDAVPGFSEEDVWDIRHYFTTRFGEEPLVRALLTGGYWEMLTDLVARLSNEDRARLLSVLWGGMKSITDTFVALASAAASLGYGREARCALDAVLGLDSRTGRFQRRTDNIISAQALTGLGRPDDQTVVVCSQFGQWVSIPRTILAALIAEVRLPVASSTSELLEKADLLEFPAIDASGAPSNLVRGLRKDAAQLGTLFMRAKSIYLLERYIEEQVITSMVVCLETTAEKVGELAGAVAAWVDKSHGNDPAARERQANGLFVCFTKLDRDFAEPNRRAKERRPDWASRLTKILIAGFGRNHGWPAQWTTSRAFDNVHLLRNPTFRAKHLLNYGNDSREIGYKPEQTGRIDRFERDFVDNDTVRRHVGDPATIWSEALELNDGGVTCLAQSICEVCDARAKSRHVMNDITVLGRSLRDRLQRYHVADDEGLQRDRRHIAALSVTRCLRRCAEEHRLGHLVRALQLTDDEFNDVLLRHEIGRQAHTNGKTNGAANGAVNGHANGHAAAGPANGHHHDVQPGVEGARIVVARNAPDLAAEARRYASVVMAHWVASTRLLAQADRVGQTLRLPRASLLQLVDELIAGAGRLDLEGRIANQIELLAADVPESTHRISRAAMSAANIISDYVMWLGCNDPHANAHPRRKGRSQTPIFPPKTNIDMWAGPAVAEDFDREFLADWSQAFLSLVAENSDDLANREVDAERNRRLGELLAELEVSL